MKILVVSLLRLGDFLMISSTIQGLKRKYSSQGVELHVLVHPEVLHLKGLFPEVDVWHALDRKTLQAGLGSVETPFFFSHDLLLNQVNQLSQLGFTKVYNFTHTEFSGWVCGAIDCEDRFGVHYSMNGNALIHSKWFQYLNSHLTGTTKEIFHLSDVIQYGAELEGPAHYQLQNTEKGLHEWESLGVSGPFVALQLFTSDTKKNWSSRSWLNMLSLLKTFRSNLTFLLLGSPAEQGQLQEFCDRANRQGVNCQVAICSLEGALAIISQSSLLITGDTSIKHLAAGTDVPVLEICLGSSDFRKTGVYKQDSVIVRAQVPCAPCGHSSKCSQPSHVCAEKVPSEAIALTAHHLIDRRWSDLKKVAAEFQEELEILQTHVCPMGFWVALPLGETSDSSVLHAILERSTTKFILQKEYLNPVAQFGSEGLQIKRWLKSHWADWNSPRLQEGLDFIETEAESTDQEIHGLLSTLRRITDRSIGDSDQMESLEDLKNFFENADGASQVLPWLVQVQDLYAHSKVVPITGLRKVQTRLDEVFQKVQVKLKLIRSIRHQIEEKI